MKEVKNNIWWVLIILLLVSIWFGGFSNFFRSTQIISLSQLVLAINEGKVKKIIVFDDKALVIFKEGKEAILSKEPAIGFSQSLLNFGVEKERLKEVEIEFRSGGGLEWLWHILYLFSPIILFFIFLWYLSRQARVGAGQIFDFTRARARLYGAGGPPKERVTFKDVAGLKEAKEELKEIVDFLKNPRKYLEMGAKIPRGVLLIGPPGTGKCVSGDTFVLTNKGWVKIQDIPKYFSVDKENKVFGAKVFTIDLKTLEKKEVLASHWYNLGKQKTIKIKTQIGIELEGTPEHPIVVWKKEGKASFKQLREIKKGDLVLINYNHQVFGNYKILPDEKTAYFLGLLIGDGGLTIKNRVFFTNSHPELVEFVKKYLRDYFKLELKEVKSRKYDWEVCDKNLKEKLKEWGIGEEHAFLKEIPESILFGPKEFQAAFLRGLFDTDGSVNEKYSTIQLGSASKSLIKQTQLLLANLGILSKTRKKKANQTGEHYFYLEISGDFCENFAKEINFGIKEKREKLEKILAKKRNSNVNVLPFVGEKIFNLFEFIREKKSFPKIFYRKTFYKLLRAYKRGEKNPTKISVDRYLEFFKKENPKIVLLPEYQILSKLANNSFFFTPVVEIEKGESVVYDFTVPKEHSFITNGIVSHNTLLAKAVAGESGVPFFYTSGSSFTELFVGVGPSRVRNLFETAKKAGRAIIFIDEIDAIGKVRGFGISGGQEEREQTLNEILNQMDGFEKESGVIVIGATNKPEMLDPALLRPGRFDRRIVLDLPDIREREEILKLHCRGKPLALNVNLREIAERTPGFSGADLANLVNEAAILAARKGKKQIFQEEFLESIDKVLLGPERKSHLLTKKEKEIAAYHEAGHAIVSAFLKEAEPVRKISIIPRGLAAGYTLKTPAEERKIKTKSEFLAEISVLLGGYCAEKLKFGEITTGAANDLEKATELAKKMVLVYGMSSLGPVAFGKREELVFLGREEIYRDFSEEVAKKIDKEIEKIVKNGENKAREILTKKKKLLEKLAQKLIQKETIEKEEFEQLIGKKQSNV